MRLIDADVLITYFKTLQAVNSGDVLFCEDLEHFIDHIEELPTVFDIDKIVEQLEEQKIPNWSASKMEKHLRKRNFEDAIEIVKKGGAK